MKSLLGKVGQSALLGGTDFGVGTLDSMGRQYVRSGTIDYQQALMDGALMGGVAGGGYLLSQFGPVNKLFCKLANTPPMQKLQQLDQKITLFFNNKEWRGYFNTLKNNIEISTANGSPQFGELSPITSLNKRQRELLDLLSEPGSTVIVPKKTVSMNDSTVIVPKKTVSMNDLRQLTNVTGDEFNMFTKSGRRLIIRGSGNTISISKEMYDDLMAGVYGKFSGHTHPPGHSLDPGPADEGFLRSLGQKRSSVWGNSDGHNEGWRPFGDSPWETLMVREQLRREMMIKFYGSE